MKIAIPVCGALCACLLIAGCSSSSSPAGPKPAAAKSVGSGGTHPGKAVGSAKLNACDILTSADVHAVLGGTVSAANAHDPDITDGPGCEYVVTGSALGAKADVLDELPDNLPPANIRDSAKHPLGTEVTVTGIGDAATYDPAEDAVLLVKDNRSILVEPILLDGTTSPAPATLKASMTALARDVANRA